MMEAWYGDDLPSDDEPVRRRETRWSAMVSPSAKGDTKEALLSSFYEQAWSMLPAYDYNCLRVLAVVPTRMGRRGFLVESELSVLDKLTSRCDDEAPGLIRHGAHSVTRDEDRIARETRRPFMTPIPPISIFRKATGTPHLGIEIAIPTGRRMPNAEPDCPSRKDLDACAVVMAEIYRAAGPNAVDLIEVTGWRLLNGVLHLELNGERQSMLAAEAVIRSHLPAQRAEWLRSFGWQSEDWHRIVKLRTAKRLATPHSAPEPDQPGRTLPASVPSTSPWAIPQGAIAVDAAAKEPAFVATVATIGVLILASFVQHAVMLALLAFIAFVFVPQMRNQLRGYRWPRRTPLPSATGIGSPTASASAADRDDLRNRIQTLLSASDAPLVQSAWAAHAKLEDLSGRSGTDIDAVQAMRLLDADMPDLVASYEIAARHASKETAEQMRIDLRRALDDVRNTCERAAQPLQRALEQDFAVHRAQIGRYANDLDTEPTR